MVDYSSACDMVYYRLHGVAHIFKPHAYSVPSSHTFLNITFKDFSRALFRDPNANTAEFETRLKGNYGYTDNV